MKIALGSDHAGYDYKTQLVEYVNSLGYEVLDFGTHSPESTDYPDFAYPTAKAVSKGEADFGVLVCGTGIGVSITANKVKGIRAANCCTVEMAKLSREHNNANVVTVGSRLINIDTAKAIVKTFIETPFEGGRHEKRVEKIHGLTGI